MFRAVPHPLLVYQHTTALNKNNLFLPRALQAMDPHLPRKGLKLVGTAAKMAQDSHIPLPINHEEGELRWTPGLFAACFQASFP